MNHITYNVPVLRSIVFRASLLLAMSGCATHSIALPDLKPIAAQANPFVSSEDYYTTSCAVDEGCTSAGRRGVLCFVA
ncbi:MAG: hypothetical protein ACR2IE_20400, partial [Candidatus Sumerlaeaceae bacterium]